MGKHIESVEEKIKKIDEEIEKLNDACASEMAEVLGGVTGRILSYAKQEEVDRIIEKYTKKIAVLMVDKDEILQNEKK